MLILPLMIFLELILNFNSETGLRMKLMSLYYSNKEIDICFYGDSQSQLNFNYATLKDEFPDLTFYNFSHPGFSISNIITFYPKNTFNCKLNIVNLHELTMSNDMINDNRSSYIWSSLTLFNLLRPSDVLTSFKNLYIGIINKRTLRKGFYNIEGNLNYDPLEIIDQYNILRLKSSSEEEIKKLIPNINDKEMLFIIHPHRKLIKEYIKNKIGESFLTKIHEKYLLDYEILNFRKIDISENLFFDNTHLNAKGSIFYTKIFIDSLKNKNSFNKLFE